MHVLWFFVYPYNIVAAVAQSATTKNNWFCSKCFNELIQKRNNNNNNRKINLTHTHLQKKNQLQHTGRNIALQILFEVKLFLNKSRSQFCHVQLMTKCDIHCKSHTKNVNILHLRITLNWWLLFFHYFSFDKWNRKTERQKERQRGRGDTWKIRNSEKNKLAAHQKTLARHLCWVRFGRAERKKRTYTHTYRIAGEFSFELTRFLIFDAHSIRTTTSEG